MWFENVTLLDLTVKGLLIGIVASAPMGPVGVLTIQRTLNKGRWFGLVTGLGAALSDIIYALMTGVGMSFVIEFIENPRKLFSDDLLFHIIKTVIGKYPAKTTKLLINSKIRSKVIV